MLGDTIKELRCAQKLSQVELAQRLGVSKQSVSNWENENILPSIEMLIKLSALLCVSTDYLLGLSEDRSLNVAGLDPESIALLSCLIEKLRKK